MRVDLLMRASKQSVILVRARVAGAKQVAASAEWLKTGSDGWWARVPAAAIQPSAHLVLAGGQSWPGAGTGLVLQKVPSEANPKVRNHGEGPY